MLNILEETFFELLLKCAAKCADEHFSVIIDGEYLTVNG